MTCISLFLSCNSIIPVNSDLKIYKDDFANITDVEQSIKVISEVWQKTETVSAFGEQEVVSYHDTIILTSQKRIKNDSIGRIYIDISIPEFVGYSGPQCQYSYFQK